VSTASAPSAASRTRNGSTGARKRISPTTTVAESSSSSGTSHSHGGPRRRHAAAIPMSRNGSATASHAMATSAAVSGTSIVRAE